MERQRMRRRRRPALSCLECRRRKIKCDRNDPCAHCVAAKIQCTFKFYADSVTQQQAGRDADAAYSLCSPSATSASAPSPTVPQTSRTNPDRPNLEDVSFPWTPQTTAAVRRDDSAVTNARIDRQPEPSNSQTPDDRSDLRELLQRIKKLEETSATNPAHALSETTQSILADQSGLQVSQTMLDKSRVLRWSHWMGTAPEFRFITEWRTEVLGHSKDFSQQDAETEAWVAQIGIGLQKCKVIARRIKLSRPSRGLSRREFELSTPAREVADMMTQLYFRSFESTHRILHIPTFWAEYQRFWDDPAKATTDLRLKILLVIAIGSSLSDYGDTNPEFRGMVQQWVYTAQVWLSGPLEKDRLNIPGLQIHCLTILARLTSCIGADLVWMSMGSLIHRAMQMGLHRDPKHLPTMPVLQAEMRRRLWATIVDMVVQSSLDSAMPPRMSFDDFDTEPPSNNNDDEIGESTTTLQPHPKNICTSTSIQLLLIGSLSTRLRILQLLNGLHSKLSYMDVLALASELNDACRANNKFMNENRSGSGVTAFHRNLLDYLMSRFMVVLHCPFVSKARANPLFHYSLKASLDAAMSIITPEPDDSFSHLMAVAGGSFREGQWYAQIAITLELLAEVEAQRRDGTLQRKSAYREFLKRAVRDMISLSTARIRRGETNIKSHMFLSMILGQVEAMELGTPHRREMARRAVESLDFCHGLLQDLAVNIAVPGLEDINLASASLDGGQDVYGMDFDLDLEFFLPDAGFT